MAIERQKQARAKGTVANKQSSIKEYLKYTYENNIHPFQITTLEFCAFIESMIIRGISPATVRNKVSHIRSWMNLARADMAEVYDKRVTMHMEAYDKTKIYTSRVKDAVPIWILKQVITSFPNDTWGWIIKTALLILAYGGFRQGEIMPQSRTSFDHMKHLVRGDVYLTETNMHIKIKDGKNLAQYDKFRACVFARNPCISMCVVHAITNMFMLQPTKTEDQPLFINPENGGPVTVTTLRNVWDQKVKSLGHDNKKFSLHSIRKTMSTVAYHAGVSELEIKSFGAWSSSAYKTYISTRADISVNNALINHYK